jgi:hypothetical protein
MTMGGLLHFVENLFHSKQDRTSASHIHRDFVGTYKADYSPLTEDEIAHEDDACADLFKHSKPVSRYK